MAVQLEQISDYKNNRENFSLLISQIKNDPENTMTDPITQLLSKPSFNAQFNNLIAQSKRFNNLFAILMLEINHPNKISDRFSSEEIDNKLIAEIGERLRKTIRDADIACHYEKNIFLILLPKMLKPEVIVHAVERIDQAVRQPFEIDGHRIEIYTHIGIAIYPFDAEDEKTLLARAQTALDKAKGEGNNLFQFYQQEVQTLGQRELMLKTAVKSPDFLNNITLEYRPYFNALSNEVVCINVLATLNHADLGKISFDEFLRIAHYSSKMYELYEWMMKSSIVKFDLSTIMESKPKRFIFTFKLKQFETPQFLEKITAIIKNLSSHDNEIIMEIADDDFENSNLESFKDAIIKLNQSNIPLAIGILVLGHFALNKLNQVHFGYLKIDKKLVENLDKRPESRAILERIMLLINSMGIGTLTTGVDTEEQKRILEELGCVTMQGKVFTQNTGNESFFIEKEPN